MGRDAYLDIETTGLNRHFCELTVVGIGLVEGAGMKVVQFVGAGISAEALLGALQDVERVFTYNGSRFDLPFIRERLGVDLRQVCEHKDLMHECWRRNLKGGLKVVEAKLGIRRRLKGINGPIAVRLWWQYVNSHDVRALETLLAYNKEDVMNLRVLQNKLGVR